MPIDLATLKKTSEQYLYVSSGYVLECCKKFLEENKGMCYVAQEVFEELNKNIQEIPGLQKSINKQAIVNALSKLSKQVTHPEIKRKGSFYYWEDVK